jgi:hypothetical protein
VSCGAVFGNGHGGANAFNPELTFGRLQSISSAVPAVAVIVAVLEVEDDRDLAASSIELARKSTCCFESDQAISAERGDEVI